MEFSKRTILVVDDEPKMRELISMYLAKEGYKIIAVEDGIKALEVIEKDEELCLSIIDVMMPKMDGFTLCREIRSFSDVPIIFLTAKGEEYERLMGFDLGADDYIIKPFSPREMVARVKAVLKRTDSSRAQGIIEPIKDFVIDIDGRQVTFFGQKISLTPKEFDLLIYLIKNQGRVLSREKITEHVWDYEYDGDQRTVDTHIKKLREKLGETGENLIKTIWGVGYKFEVN